jgi:hypothetical protein
MDMGWKESRGSLRVAQEVIGEGAHVRMILYSFTMALANLGTALTSTRYIGMGMVFFRSLNDVEMNTWRYK